MTDDVHVQLLLGENYCVTLAELAASSGFNDVELHELIELGALPARQEPTGWVFAAHCLELARAARQLRADFDLSLPGVALVLAYRERVHELEQQLRDVECLLPRGR